MYGVWCFGQNWNFFSMISTNVVFFFFICSPTLPCLLLQAWLHRLYFFGDGQSIMGKIRQISFKKKNLLMFAFFSSAGVMHPVTLCGASWFQTSQWEQDCELRRCSIAWHQAFRWNVSILLWIMRAWGRNVSKLTQCLLIFEFMVRKAVSGRVWEIWPPFTGSELLV